MDETTTRGWRSRKVITGTVAVLAIAAGAGAAVAASGEGGDSGSSSSAATTPTSPSAEAASFLADVAERLGIPTAELESAVEAESLERLDQAVADGRIPEDRAAELRERIEAGELPLGGIGPHGGPGHHEGRAGGPGNVLDAAATALGIEPEALLEELRSGKTLAEVAEANGSSAQALADAIVADAEQDLTEAVADGRLTEAQKDELLSRLKEHVDELVQGTLPGPGGDMRDHGPFGDGDGGDGSSGSSSGEGSSTSGI